MSASGGLGFGGHGTLSGFQGLNGEHRAVTGFEFGLGLGAGVHYDTGITATKVFHIDPWGFFAHFNPFNVFGDDQRMSGRKDG